MLGAALASALFAIVNNALSVRVGQSFAADVRSALVRRVQSFSFGNLDRLQTGQLIVRSTSDVNFVQMIVQMSLRILTRAPIWMLGAIGFLFATSIELGWIVLAFFPEGSSKRGLSFLADWIPYSDSQPAPLDLIADIDPRLGERVGPDWLALQEMADETSQVISPCLLAIF